MARRHRVRGFSLMKHLSTEALETEIGHQFVRHELLEQALTHSSHARESEPGASDNEQLEFLGDAVLGFVTGEELFTRFPQFQEGELSKLRAHLVSARHLVRVANELELGSYLRLGRGEEKTGGRTKAALLVDALEAVLAAMYLDGGLDKTRDFILKRIVRPELERLSPGKDELLLADYKSRLQEELHKCGRPQPNYVQTGAEGPEHKKIFRVEVHINGGDNRPAFSCAGEGSSKKRAEQLAAQRALIKLEETLIAGKDKQ